MTRGDLTKLRESIVQKPGDPVLLPTYVGEDGKRRGCAAPEEFFARVSIVALDLIALAEKRAEDSRVMLVTGELCNGIDHKAPGHPISYRAGSCDCSPAEVAGREIT